MKLLITIFLTRDWENYHRRPEIESIAKTLGSEGLMLCINPALSFYSCKRISKRSVKKVSDNMYLITPVAPPYAPLNRIIDLSERISGCYKDNLIKTLNYFKTDEMITICWLYHPMQIDNLYFTDWDAVIYECYDQYSAAPRLSESRMRDIVENERIIMNKSDIVFVTSEELYRDKMNMNKNIYLMENAVDYDMFVCETVEKARDDVTIGYIGRINERVDLSLIRILAEKRKDWKIVMIGEIEVDIGEIAGRSNIIFRGKMKYSNMVHTARSFDVCIIPYKTDIEFNKYADLMKIYEYSAMGKPIVSTDLPCARRRSNVVRIAQESDEYIRMIEEAIRENNADLIKKRTEYAKMHTWDKRSENMKEIIVKYVGKRK